MYFVMKKDTIIAHATAATKNIIERNTTKSGWLGNVRKGESKTKTKKEASDRQVRKYVSCGHKSVIKTATTRHDYQDRAQGKSLCKVKISWANQAWSKPSFQ